MPGPTLQQREQAAGVPCKCLTSWQEKIVPLKKHIADLREMIANE